MECAHLGKSSLNKIQATEKTVCGNANRMTWLDNKKWDEMATCYDACCVHMGT